MMEADFEGISFKGVQISWHKEREMVILETDRKKMKLYVFHPG